MQPAAHTQAPAAAEEGSSREASRASGNTPHTAFSTLPPPAAPAHSEREGGRERETLDEVMSEGETKRARARESQETTRLRLSSNHGLRHQRGRGEEVREHAHECGSASKRMEEAKDDAALESQWKTEAMWISARFPQPVSLPPSRSLCLAQRALSLSSSLSCYLTPCLSLPPSHSLTLSHSLSFSVSLSLPHSLSCVSCPAACHSLSHALFV